MNSNPAPHPTDWTPRLLWLTATCSAVFTIGTALQNFVIVDLAMLEHTMRLAGQTPAEAAANAPGFLTGFRAVGCVYIVGNALGLLALTGRAWVFWVVLAVNVTQAAGVFVIPPEVFRASLTCTDRSAWRRRSSPTAGRCCCRWCCWASSPATAPPGPVPGRIVFDLLVEVLFAQQGDEGASKGI